MQSNGPEWLGKVVLIEVAVRENECRDTLDYDERSSMQSELLNQTVTEPGTNIIHEIGH